MLPTVAAPRRMGSHVSAPWTTDMPSKVVAVSTELTAPSTGTRACVRKRESEREGVKSVYK